MSAWSQIFMSGKARKFLTSVIVLLTITSLSNFYLGGQEVSRNSYIDTEGGPSYSSVNGTIAQNDGSLLASGSYHFCAIDSEKDIKCWGNKAFIGLCSQFEVESCSYVWSEGEENGEEIYDTNIPNTIPIPNGTIPIMIEIGGFGVWGQTCALLWNPLADIDLKLYCWDGFMFPRELNLPINESIVDFGIGKYHSCALTESYKVHCWGSNSNSGALGNGIDEFESIYNIHDDFSFSSLDFGARNVTALSVGAFHNCVVLDRFEVSCWGGNHRGSLGIPGDMQLSDVNGTEKLTTPYDVEMPDFKGEISSIDSGLTSTCVVTTVGEQICWGSNVMINQFLGVPYDVGIQPKLFQLFPPNQKAISVEISEVGNEEVCFILTEGFRCWSEYGNFPLVSNVLVSEIEFGYGDTICINDQIQLIVECRDGGQGRGVPEVTIPVLPLPDSDDDSVSDFFDIFPNDPLEWEDYDRDGLGDNTDIDDDGDGVLDILDSCPKGNLDWTSDDATDQDGDGCIDVVNDALIDTHPCINEWPASHGIFARDPFYEDICDIAIPPETGTPDPRYSRITGISYIDAGVDGGVNGLMNLTLSADGSIFAFINEYKTAKVYYLDEPNKSFSKIIGDVSWLFRNPSDGSVSFIRGEECFDLIYEQPCSGEYDGNPVGDRDEYFYWTGPFFFSHEYKPCKMGWTGWFHCPDGWYKAGNWDGYDLTWTAPSVYSYPVYDRGSLPCHSCSSPDGRYFVMPSKIATDFELLGNLDADYDVLLARTETWFSQQEGFATPGGIGTIIGGIKISECNSLSCQLAPDPRDGFGGLGGFAWAGDSSHVYIATSDTIYTLDPDTREYSEIDNPYNCDGFNPSLTGVSNPNGSKIIIPCGEGFVVLDIDVEDNPSSEQGLDFYTILFVLCCGLILPVILLFFKGIEANHFWGFIVLAGIILLVLIYADGYESNETLELDPIELREEIDIKIEFGIMEDGNMMLLEIEDDVPVETLDILLVNGDFGTWLSMDESYTWGNNDQYIRFSLEQYCMGDCELEAGVFYRGELMASDSFAFNF